MRPAAHWLKPIGASGWRLDPDWITVAPRELEWVDFQDRGRPNVHVDDYLVYYATGHGHLFGIVKIFMPPTRKPEGGRWPWEAQVRPGIIIAEIDRGPTLAVASVAGRDLKNSISMGAGHVQLKAEEWEAALGALRAVCSPDKGDILDEYYLP